MCLRSGLQLYDAIPLKPCAHGSAKIDRLYYRPEFLGPVSNGSYNIVDDVYTSGRTLHSSTTFTRIIPKMFTDTARYTSLAGVSVSEFTFLLEKDANEASIRFLEGFRGNGAGFLETPFL